MSDKPYAKVIDDSISEAGRRLTTFEVCLNRFVLAEFNTHRIFSRNSASSRAIPFPKQIERIINDCAYPLEWPAEQKGMQGGEPLGDEEQRKAGMVWAAAAGAAMRYAQQIADLGVHKSVVNRLLEPFMWHTVVVTATGWENFFRQRVSPLAQPEIREPATMMLDAYKQSEPRLVKPGEWHLPYVDLVRDQNDIATMSFGSPDFFTGSDEGFDFHLQEIGEMLVKVSAARCARVSYLTQDGRRDIQEDLNLYERLTSADPMHASPLEHAATPAPWNEQDVTLYTDPITGLMQRVVLGKDPVVDEVLKGHTKTITVPIVGNFLGWQQQRMAVEMTKEYEFYA